MARSVGRSRATLRRAEAQAGRFEASQQLPALDDRRAGVDERVTEFFGDVVVVALETTTRDVVVIGEVVELVERLVAHQMAPAATAVPPSRFVHQDRHVEETGTLEP